MRSRREAFARSWRSALILSMAAPVTAAASVPLSFPADQSLVPVAVGTAFALPAILALLYVSLGWIARIAAKIMLAGVGVAVAAFCVELAQPGSLKAPMAWLAQNVLGG